MKKKILLLLALCFMLPLSILLTACGGHSHTPAADWSSDETYHWHACEECDEKLDKAAHDFSSKRTTQEYFHSDATVTSGVKYYYSCSSCLAKGTETFELPKQEADVMAYLDLDKTYDRKPVLTEDSIANIGYSIDSNSDGEILAVEFKLASADDSTYSTQAPVDAGVYKVRITIAETLNFEEAKYEEEFTISPIHLNNISVSKQYDGTSYIDAELSDSEIIQGDELFLHVTMSGKNIDAMPVEDEDFALTGADAQNYVLDFDNVSAYIAQKVLYDTICLTKEYNRNANVSATLTSEDVEGIVEGETLNISFSATSMNVGTANVDSSFVVTGDSAQNYLIHQDQVQVTITPKTLNFVMEEQYNGTLQYTHQCVVADGKIESDEALFALLAPSSKNVGTYSTKDGTLTSSLVNVNLQENPNYVIGDVTLTIKPKEIYNVKLTVVQEEDGIYEIILSSGIIEGENVNFTIDACESNDIFGEQLYVMNSHQTGDYYVHLISISGTDAGNYVVRIKDESKGQYHVFLTITQPEA